VDARQGYNNPIWITHTHKKKPRGCSRHGAANESNPAVLIALVFFHFLFSFFSSGKKKKINLIVSDIGRVIPETVERNTKGDRTRMEMRREVGGDVHCSREKYI